MFIPKRCPRCRDALAWTEAYNPHLTNALEKAILFFKGKNTSDFLYCCEKCGYEGEYDNHAEILNRNLRRR